MAECEKEAEIPLQQLEVDGEPKVKTSGVFGGLFLNKTKLIVLAVLILILLIIIIVLAAVLGHERAKERREIRPSGEKEEKEEVSPTSVGPTTPGPEPWWTIRLPGDIKPYHYDLTLNIDLNKPNFKGTFQKLSGGVIPIKRHFEFEKNQFLVIELESPLDKGRYITTVEYSGKYSDDLRGMYKSSFIDKNGNESLFSATQFEPLRARRAFPCFDEPAMKATFTVIVVHDPRLIALSNMPIYQSEVKDGWKYDHFNKTVKMSTYLVAFAVGDFKYKEAKTKNGIKIRIYAREEVLDQVDYALSVSNLTMTYFEEFFGIPYPLPKSDGIALPTFGPGGMENWGLIKYQEKLLLMKEGESASSAKESIVKIVAHEIGHQWFGNIVTMEWWTDLWLNEGFATYVSSIGVNHVHPEWKIIDQFIVRAVQDSLQLDGLASSHPIRIPVEDPQKISEIFDAISYKKGASVLVMLHSYLGNAIFRDGLKRYLTKHAYSNAETDDLWDAMTEASQAAGKVTDVLNKWVIPFTYYKDNRRSDAPPKVSLSAIIDKDPVEVKYGGSEWIKGNIGQTGFYRVITKKRTGIYFRSNCCIITRANLLNHTKALSISSYLIKEEDYVPLLSAMRKFEKLLEILPSKRPAYKYVQYNKIGMKDQGTLLERFQRTILIDANCAAGVKSCLGNMTQMFRQWMDDPVNKPVPADLKTLVYHFGVVTGGEKEWDFVYSQFKSTDVVSDKSILLYAMAGSQEPWIIERYLEYTLDRSKIGPRYLSYAMYYISDSNEFGTNVAWNFFQLKWETRSKMFGGPYRTLGRFVPYVSKRFSTEFETTTGNT
ncbi:hypothetical protein OS493_003330 [Desmophyllum pertusum]|uniref:Aminopeptidase n=1 Tax=Desmophyllum pertusum TaxID=174260 RepID=A0A9X0DCG6_9CNID|nr:hypothetical protein OS493_003330 [Desmophyllum pertusum]